MSHLGHVLVEYLIFTGCFSCVLLVEELLFCFCKYLSSYFQHLGRCVEVFEKTFDTRRVVTCRSVMLCAALVWSLSHRDFKDSANHYTTFIVSILGSGCFD